MDITAPKRVQRARRSRFVRFLGFISALSLVVCLAVSSAASFILWKASKDLPDYEVLAKYEPAVTTRVYANDGNLIANLHERGGSQFLLLQFLIGSSKHSFRQRIRPFTSMVVSTYRASCALRLQI